MKLIETDDFPFEFLSQIGERESWRKEVHRPIYHVHKWWAKRLGSVFRGIILGSILSDHDDLSHDFYEIHDFEGVTVLDPFMGSGTTIGEAHKLGCRAFGRDINPVAVEAVRVALGPLERERIESSFAKLKKSVSKDLLALYRSVDADGEACDVLYHFWVMQADCPECGERNDLFPSFVFSRNAYPKVKPEVQLVCPECSAIFQSTYGKTQERCSECKHRFDPTAGTTRGSRANCRKCDAQFSVLAAIGGKRPSFRHYCKLVLTEDGNKQYLPTTDQDIADYRRCSSKVRRQGKTLHLPSLQLTSGHNTKQAMGYGFLTWRDFFNDRQLLALSILHEGICNLTDPVSRKALLTLFSGVLEFNNMFASYKGEGTGAVRHMFAHHILKPERTPIEANVWGTPKSSGAFSNLYKSRLLRAIDYRESPVELGQIKTDRPVCSRPFSGKLEDWKGSIGKRAIALSCGDSAATGLRDASVDLVVTDPPFFDNVHYSELADFFFAWQQLSNGHRGTTRNQSEVQDANAAKFSEKLRSVFAECKRVLKNDGLLVFTYHHSRNEGWSSIADAILGAGFTVVNSHPVKSEMSVATPKSQAKAPIQLDIVIVCRKAKRAWKPATVDDAISAANAKSDRLVEAGFKLSTSDLRIIRFGQLLTTIRTADQISMLLNAVEDESVTC